MTLVELIVTLSLLTAIVATVSGGLQLGRRVWERGRADDGNLALEAALRAVTDTLAASYPVTVADPDGIPQLLFVGQNDRCRFVFLSNGDSLPGGLINGDFGVDPGAAKPILTLWTSLYRPATALKTIRSSMLATPVLPGPVVIEFAYAGFDRGGLPTGWLQTWTGEQSLPQVIQVKLSAGAVGSPRTISAIVELPQR